MDDMVNNPPHYKLSNGMEVIDIIEESLTPEEFRGYLKGNDLKYLFREPYKGNSEQDVSKSIWYAERYKEALAKKADKPGVIVVPTGDIEFYDTQFTVGGIFTQRLSVQIPSHEAQRLASQMVHPAYSNYQLALTWEKK